MKRFSFSISQGTNLEATNFRSPQIAPRRGVSFAGHDASRRANVGSSRLGRSPPPERATPGAAPDEGGGGRGSGCGRRPGHAATRCAVRVGRGRVGSVNEALLRPRRSRSRRSVEFCAFLLLAHTLSA